MTEDEKYVREQCVNVELHDDIAPEVWCDGEVYGRATYDKGDTEEEAWANAANAVRTRLQQIRQRQLDCEVLQHFAEDQDGSYEGKAFERILAREQAALADLKRGLRVAEERTER